MFSEKNTKCCRLTARQIEVLRLFAEGNSIKQIALLLFRSVNTINAHRRRILLILEAKSIANACWIAAKEGRI